jgi:hypothetical protein
VFDPRTVHPVACGYTNAITDPYTVLYLYVWTTVTYLTAQLVSQTV